MGLKVEVSSVEKACSVIIDLDAVIEIAPLRDGGCSLFFSRDPMIAPMNIKNDYTEFKQFVIQTVSTDDIAKRIQALRGPQGVLEEYPELEVKRKPGRPPASA